MLYRGMDRAQLDDAYNNSAAVPERDAIVADWAARSARVRREYAGRLDLAYGETPRERLDLFLAAGPKAPTLAFIHGGYWQMNDKESFESSICCARLPLEFGWLVAGVGSDANERTNRPVFPSMTFRATPISIRAPRRPSTTFAFA